MDLLLFFVLASLAGAGSVALVIVWTTQRAAASAITRYFQASEIILATGNPPPDWLKPRRRWLRIGKASPSQSELLKRLDELTRFFEQCRFYEDDFSRDEMLAQLAAIRQAWQERPPTPA